MVTIIIVMEKRITIVLIFLNLILILPCGKKIQGYIYPYQERKTLGSLEKIEGLHAFARDQKYLYYKGRRLEEANFMNIREIQGQYYTEYFADGEHVYYQDKLLSLQGTKDLRTLRQEKGDVEYVFNPVNGELFVGENYLKDSRLPHTIIWEGTAPMWKVSFW